MTDELYEYGMCRMSKSIQWMVCSTIDGSVLDGGVCAPSEIAAVKVRWQGDANAAVFLKHVDGPQGRDQKTSGIT